MKTRIDEILNNYTENFNCDNQNKSWNDEDLKEVLREAPLNENVLKFAMKFNRTPGSIIRIYGLANDPKQKQEDSGVIDNKFNQQIQKIKKEIGWIR